MSPLPASTNSSAKDVKKESTVARLVGAGSAGIAELAVFHPVDTVAKRLMSNQAKVNGLAGYNSVIFKQTANAGLGTRFISLFPGLGYAAAYKVLQRVYKYGGQPFVRDFLAKNYGGWFDRTFGKGTGKTMMHASAGSLVGIGEIVLLPLDVLKIKRQTNPEAFRGRGIFKILADEGFGLYRGWGWTAARNAPGSFALFGGSAVTKEYLFKLKDYNAATWGQNFVASIGGATASLLVSAPLDVVKTRIQNRNFENPETGMRIMANMLKNEGISSFFKGLVPKLLMTGPKLVFSFWLAQTLIPVFDKLM
ncbi:solute carrier protein [Saccharata proteae CBS 121410]|uniref:Solute carrier protein n=1 Tax=Saccharata proteae CBS 121410 TaxID=1314787 RepID=A0A9P4HQ66_9PEZI|nr:solute carrier protein [Saccharata proteae CBS 121410]